MMRLSIVLSAALLACSLLVAVPAPGEDGKPDLDRDEAKKAFEYLNQIRANPPAFSKDIGADLKDVKARPALKWNATLVKVAEEKAADMAKRE